VAEHSQLFPVFHSLETAFRSTTAVVLEERYKTSDWWAPSKKAVTSSAGPQSVRAINGVPITKNIAATIGYMVSDLISKKVDFTKLNSGYELLEETDLYHIERLIHDHWPSFRSIFVREDKLLGVIKFVEQFKWLREARNAVYHHQSFTNLARAYQSAEDMLAYLDFPLPRVHQRIHYSVCPPPPYKWIRR
jgi:hypothetical protein